MPNSKWTKPGLNSERLTHYVNSNIDKLDAGRKGYRGENEKMAKASQKMLLRLNILLIFYTNLGKSFLDFTSL